MTAVRRSIEPVNWRPRASPRKCYTMTPMTSTVGVRELRQNLSRYLERIKQGESLVVTERGREVARLVPSGASSERYRQLAERFGATVPTARLPDVAARLDRTSR